MADTPNKWEKLSKREQDEAREIRAKVSLPGASLSQVGKWLDAFRDFAGGYIDKDELYERTDHSHGSPRTATAKTGDVTVAVVDGTVTIVNAKANTETYLRGAVLKGDDGVRDSAAAEKILAVYGWRVADAARWTADGEGNITAPVVPGRVVRGGPREGAGRPEIGNQVLIRLGPLLPRVDAYAAAQTVSRAEGIRQLLELSLLEWEQERDMGR